MSTLRKLLKDPSTIVVDVRSPIEFETGHVPGAKNIPVEEIASRVGEFKSFHAPVVLYCRSGNRSGIAVNILKQQGVSDVYNGGSLEDLHYLSN